MTKKLIIFLGIFIGALLMAEYFILGNAILSGSAQDKPQSKEEFCKKYPRHKGCWK